MTPHYGTKLVINDDLQIEEVPRALVTLKQKDNSKWISVRELLPETLLNNYRSFGSGTLRHKLYF